MLNKTALTEFIKKSALEVGFDACGIAKAQRLDTDADFMKKWLAEGRHAEMEYLDRNFEKRVDPTVLVEGCKSVIVVLMNYYPTEVHQPSTTKIAKYAWSGVDYHYVLKEKLKSLRALIADEYGENCFSDTAQHQFVDSAPILERRWAERAGLGWIGKNKMLINPTFGSYVFIGVLLINKELDYDEPIPPRCGKCQKCLISCPTQALSVEKGIDSHRCISYQTIEKRGEISPEIQSKLSGNIFGCDICMDVCPWNKKRGKPNRHNDFASHSLLSLLQTDKITELGKPDFKKSFKNTVFQRAGLKKLQENYKYAQRQEKKEE